MDDFAATMDAVVDRYRAQIEGMRMGFASALEGVTFSSGDVIAVLSETMYAAAAIGLDGPLTALRQLSPERTLTVAQIIDMLELVKSAMDRLAARS